jgi:multiple sugar transport system permease protein
LKNSIRTLKKIENIKGWMLSLPYWIFASIFFGYAFIWLVVLAMSKWNFILPRKIIWLRNFIHVFQDPMFWTVTWNTTRFMIYYIPSVLVLSLALAIALSKAKRFGAFFAMSFLVANVSSGVAYSIVFSKIFSSTGPVNNFLFDTFGIVIPWFTDPTWAMLSIVIIVLWKFIGYYALIFLAGLQAIPKELYEAADLDGATKWTKFFKITLPLLNPSFVMIIVLAIGLSFGIFTEPYMITEGGPLNSTQTFMVTIYTTAFEKYQPGYAAAWSIIAAVMSFSLIWISRKLVERDVSFS